jgi:Ku protein
MATRPYWKGILKLSLVSCPVALYPASTTAEKTHFHQINAKTKHRLRQQMIDEETGDVVDQEEKTRGYEISKGKYVEVETDDLKAIQIESTHTLEIDRFVPKDEIDQRYRENPYYIAPDGKDGLDAFAVIRDAMKNKDREALARIVMANREHVVAIEPLDKGLLGTRLRYPYEIRDAKDYFDDIGTPRITKDMVKLAEHILSAKSAHFDPSKFKDEYERALRALVKRKAAGKTITVPDEPPADRGNVIDLMDALKKSLKKRAPKSAATKKPANARRARKTKRQRKAA